MNWEKCGPQLVDALRRVLDEGLISGAATHNAAHAALARYERAANIGGPADFLRARYGANWVLARRTKNIVERYGDSVVCLSQKQYRQCEEDYLRGLPP